MASRVTLSSLDQKLESFTETVTKQLERLADAVDGNGKPGLKTRVEVAETRLESHRKLGLWCLSVIGTIIAGIILKLIAG